MERYSWLASNRCTMAAKYVGCSLSLPSTAKRRLLLSDRITKDIVDVFSEIVYRKYPSARETLVTERSLLCQPCFRRLEGILKLRRQLAMREKMVEDTLEHSILTSYPASIASSSASEPRSPAAPTSAISTPPRSKQARIHLGSGLTHRRHTPRRRRPRIDTPTRHAIGRLQPEVSPIVAVSLYITLMFFTCPLFIFYRGEILLWKL